MFNVFLIPLQAISAGKYLVQTTEVYIGQLVLQWDHRRTTTKSTRSNKLSNTVIRVPEDIRALDVSVDQSTRSREIKRDHSSQVTHPNTVELGTPPQILVTVSTGRNEVERLKLRLVCPNITWKYSEAHAEGDFPDLIPGHLNTDQSLYRPDENFEIQNDNDGLILHSLDEDEDYSFVLPHSGSSSMHDLVCSKNLGNGAFVFTIRKIFQKIHIEVEYVTAQQPTLERRLTLTRVLFTTLPISVNVQDFFRGSKSVREFGLESGLLISLVLD